MNDSEDVQRERLGRRSRLSLRVKGVAALSVPMAALFAALFAIIWAETAAQRADVVVVQAYDTRAALLQLRIYLADADASVSRYLATSGSGSLPSLETSRSSAEATLARISSLVGDDDTSIRTLGEIRAASRQELDIMGQLRTADPALRPPLLERSRELTGEIQERLRIMNEAQQLRLIRALYNRDAARQELFKVVVVCGVLGPIGALFVHLLIAGRLVKRLQTVSENAHRLAHGLPLKPSSPGSDEIAELAEQLEEAAHLLGERQGELRERERRYRELFDQAPIPYKEIDRDGIIRHFNAAACELLGCAPKDVLGRPAWEFVDPDRQEAFRDAMLERIAAGRESGPFECDYSLDDGSRITVEIRENLIRNERGEITGVCRSLLDVTERRLATIAARKVEQYALELRNRNEQLGRALEAARSAAVAKSRFLAGVSHELRTPLNGIIGFSELLYDGKLGGISEEQREILGDILTSARHLLNLINDILDLSKIEAGKMLFRPEPTNIEEIVNEVRDVVRPLAEKKDLQVALEVPGGFSAVTDPGRFKQVLYNYLSNAVKFTPAGGAVTVRISPEGDQMFRLDVEDTGIGIASEELPQLFQEFQQLPNSRKAEQGTGLGLALTRRIVEAQGGYVGVASQLGKGSVFSAVLPKAAAVKAASGTA